MTQMTHGWLSQGGLSPTRRAGSFGPAQPPTTSSHLALLWDQESHGGPCVTPTNLS